MAVLFNAPVTIWHPYWGRSGYYKFVFTIFLKLACYEFCQLSQLYIYKLPSSNNHQVTKQTQAKSAGLRGAKPQIFTPIRARGGMVWAGMAYRQFFVRLETIPPLLSDDCKTGMS